MKNKTVLWSITMTISAIILICLFFLTRNHSQESNTTSLNSHRQQSIGQNETSNSSKQTRENTDVKSIKISVDGREMTATLATNEAAIALVERLQEKPITLKLTEYGGFEQVGDLGFSLPSSDRQVTTKNGDIVLYQGDEISIFYGSNSWRYTPLGNINNVSKNELRDIFGVNKVTVQLSY